MGEAVSDHGLEDQPVIPSTTSIIDCYSIVCCI